MKHFEVLREYRLNRKCINIIKPVGDVRIGISVAQFVYDFLRVIHGQLILVTVTEPNNTKNEPVKSLEPR